MPDDSLNDVIDETRRAAKELAEAVAKLTKRAFAKAEAASNDPSLSARKVAQRVAKDLDAAAKEVDRILRDL